MPNSLSQVFSKTPACYLKALGRQSMPEPQTPSSRIFEFYSGTGPDHQGRYLPQILEWPDDDLESVHDYIQWLFPLSERSGFNPSAPVLDRQTIQEFRSRPDLQQNMRASFLRMLAFYGLEIIGSSPPTVSRAPSFATRSGNWLIASNHNHLRVTRILKSTWTLGLETECTALFDCLADIYREESEKDFPGISYETFRFWQSAALGS
jgi:Opioid growth factor receptor (OGFr) conserved region